jgi:hypothetical protein
LNFYQAKALNGGQVKGGLNETEDHLMGVVYWFENGEEGYP